MFFSEHYLKNPSVNPSNISRTFVEHHQKAHRLVAPKVLPHQVILSYKLRTKKCEKIKNKNTALLGIQILVM
jgi:hypothetical protein